jgi:hypothetical protein
MRRNAALMTAAAVTALLGALLAVAPALALPRSVTSFLLGPAMVRADVVARTAGGVHLYRVERGRVRSIGAASIVLHERDGTNVTVPVAPDAVLAGVPKARAKLGALLGLRRGMTVATVQDGERPAERVRVLEPALALPPGFISSLFGVRMARADIVVQSGAPVLYRIDRGRIRSIGTSSIVVRERDGTLATVPIAENAAVTGVGRGRLRNGVLAALRRNMLVETVREGDQPAEHVHVTGH